MEKNLGLKIDWASLIAGGKFTIFALFYFVFDGNFPNISPPGTCTWKIALKYKVKQSKNDKFTPNYRAGPIDFETQISLRR